MMTERAVRLYAGLFFTVLGTLVGVETAKNFLRWFQGQMMTSISIDGVYTPVPVEAASLAGLALVGAVLYIIHRLTAPLLTAPDHFVAAPTFQEVARENHKALSNYRYHPEKYPLVCDTTVLSRLSDGCSGSPVVQDSDGRWYFWDETWTSLYGPWATWEAVEKAFSEYVREL